MISNDLPDAVGSPYWNLVSVTVFAEDGSQACKVVTGVAFPTDLVSYSKGRCCDDTVGDRSGIRLDSAHRVGERLLGAVRLPPRGQLHPLLQERRPPWRHIGGSNYFVLSIRSSITAFFSSFSLQNPLFYALISTL